VLNGNLAIFCGTDRVAIRRQQFGQKMPFSGRVIDNQDVLDRHISEETIS
jgi:hypothetical protein